jgi:hypothetical protein
MRESIKHNKLKISVKEIMDEISWQIDTKLIINDAIKDMGEVFI